MNQFVGARLALLAGADRWTPSDLFGPTDTGFLFESEPVSNFWQDVSRITPVTSDNDPIGSAKDKVAGAYATQATSGKRPFWTASGIGTDGVDDSLDTGINPPLEGTILVAGAAVAGGQFIGASAATNGRLYLGLNGSGYIGGGIGNNSISTIVIAGSVIGSFGVYALSWDHSTVKLYKNGVKGYEGAQNGDVTTAYSVFLGGVNAAGTGAGFIQATSIKSWMLIDRALTLSEIQQLTAYYGV